MGQRVIASAFVAGFIFFLKLNNHWSESKTIVKSMLMH